MKNKILLGTGITAIIGGVIGLFAADKMKKNNKFITVISGIVAIVGLGLTAKVLDEELYPEELEEENDDSVNEDSENEPEESFNEC